MKNSHLMLRASIAAALAASSALASANVTGVSGDALAGINTTELPRVTRTTNNEVISSIRKTHPTSLSHAEFSGALDDTTPMEHMQLILQSSVERNTQLEYLLGQQHDPNSIHFHRWLTPEQYGNAFGVLDNDVAAVSAWLTSQGFTVNGVYPSKMQIDFSGTAGQVRRSFHTQEAYYTINGKKRIANTTDISVPTALQPVIAGVLGLNSLQAESPRQVPIVGQWNASTHKFMAAATSEGHAQTIPLGGIAPSGTRGLVPDDFQHIYGVSTLLSNGVSGKGITIAVVENANMVPSDWTNFVTQFNLAQYGGSFSQIQPEVSGMTANCLNPDVNTYTGVLVAHDTYATIRDAEYVTAMAPGADVVVASCGGGGNALSVVGGVSLATLNLINENARPDIISVSTAQAEDDTISKATIDQMMAQADAEGISVFAATGDSGINPFFGNGSNLINGEGVEPNSMATSPNVTAVGGTGFADIIDGTTGQYFNVIPNALFGTAKGYVPEIPWNESCGNGVVAKARGWSSAPAFCQAQLAANQSEGEGNLLSNAGGGGASTVDAKPSWQNGVTGIAPDQSRDVPDVALFAGAYGGRVNPALPQYHGEELDDSAYVILCENSYPCTPDFSGGLQLANGTALSVSMMAGIQALIDQGIAMRGLPADQGNAAPTLYALAQQEYGTGQEAPPTSLTACSADKGTAGTSSCVFHNIDRGSISTNCQQTGTSTLTPNCSFYGTTDAYFPGSGVTEQVGLTALDPSQPYSQSNKAYGAQPGWSFASGLGSVDARNLLIAWRAFVHAPAAP